MAKLNSDNFIFRENVVLFNDCDIFSICETYLSDNAILELNDYKWIGHNKKQRHAKRGSGGEGIFVTLSFFERYQYCVRAK